MRHLAVAFSCLMATSALATPPTPPTPLEVRLARMDVIVVGLLSVNGEGQDKMVSLDITHVLKRPDDLKELKPGAVLTVTPRPAGFSDQAGKGVWSLDIDRKGDDLLVLKYEFITYARNFLEIKEKLEALADDAKPTKKAAERAEVLKKNIKLFSLQLLYYGPQDKPYYNLTISLVPGLAGRAFHPILQIDEDQAAKIIGYLATEGFLDEATEPKEDRKLPETSPGYTLYVRAKDVIWHSNLGWDLKMLKRLDGLAGVMEGEAAKAMDRLLARLSGHRRVWESEGE